MAMYRAVREKHCRHRLSVAGFETQRYGISPRSEGEALMAMMAKQRFCCAQQESALQRQRITLSRKVMALLSSDAQGQRKGLQRNRQALPRKSIACPGYDPRFVETRRDGYALTRVASEARCTARKRAAKAMNCYARKGLRQHSRGTAQHSKARHRNSAEAQRIARQRNGTARRGEGVARSRPARDTIRPELRWQRTATEKFNIL